MRPARFVPAGTGLVLLALSGGAALADDACSQFSWSIAREQKAFAGPGLAILHSGEAYPGPLAGVTVALEPQNKVTYPVPPAKTAKANPSYGAVLVAPPIAVAGTYQVTLSEAAWVDLVQNGKTLRFAAFAGKGGCPGVRKSVRFNLVPGPLTIELSDSAKQTLNLDLLPAE